MRRVGVALLFSLSMLLNIPTLDATSSLSTDRFPPANSQLSPGVAVEIFEDRNFIKAYEGHVCGMGSGVIETNYAIRFPEYVDQATVYQNGWWAKFQGADDSDDHHVLQIVSFIYAQGYDPGSHVLKWANWGVLEDEPKNPSEVCHYFIAVGWNSRKIDAHPFMELLRGGDYTASGIASLVDSDPGHSLPRVSPALPRGFDIRDQTGFSGGDDHHLLQLGYAIDMNPNSRLLISSLVWKDNGGIPFWGAADYIATLTGTGVVMEWKRPPLVLRPEEPISWPTACISTPAFAKTVEEETREYVVGELALPVLVGWNLSYRCYDNHVKAIGIYIHDVRWEPVAGTPRHKLKYKISSILRDKDHEPGFTAQSRVNVLRFRACPPGAACLEWDSSP